MIADYETAMECEFKKQERGGLPFLRTVSDNFPCLLHPRCSASAPHQTELRVPSWMVLPSCNIRVSRLSVDLPTLLVNTEVWLMEKQRTCLQSTLGPRAARPDLPVQQRTEVGR